MHWISRSCPSCGDGNPSKLYASAKFSEKELNAFSFSSRKLPDGMHFELHRCQQCQLVYVSKAPNTEWFINQYHTADFDAEEASYYAANTYSRYLLDHIELLPDRKLAIDIGAGDGAFLMQLKDNFNFENIIGFEPSQAPLQIARRDIQEKILNKPFQIEECTPNSASFVTIFQTLEHVTEPVTLLQQVFKLLKPGGVFMVICHNVDSVTAKILGTKSPIFDIEHLQLFNPSSLHHMLNKIGFEKLHIGSVKNCYPLNYWSRLSPLPTHLKDIVETVLSKTRLGKVPIPFYPGNLYALGIKPYV